MENERLLSERLLSVDEMHADCKMKPLGELLISQDAKTTAVRDKWWIRNVERRQDILHMEDHELFIDGEYLIMLASEWHSLKESLEGAVTK